MYCPETVIAWRNSFVYIVRHDRTDYVGQPVPWRERLNLLRYQVTIKWPWRFTINRGGKANWWLAEVMFKLRRKDQS